MTQLDMFEEQAHRRAELKVKPELTDFNKSELVEFYVNEYIVRKGFGGYSDGKWWYTKDEYKLLHHLMEFALTKKNKIQGYVLANKMFNNNNTEKLRNYIRALRNDPLVDVHIGSHAGGYYIGGKSWQEVLECYELIKNKAISEMITVILNVPYYAKTFIKIASLFQGKADTAVDGQLMAQIDNETNELMEELEMMIRSADTLKHESYRKG
jgi:hypothetical protein